MQNNHALLSASGSERWLNCPPSARLEEQFPKSTTSYADEGTAAHEIAELTARYWLNKIKETAYKNKLAKLSKGEYYNAEMQEHADDYAQIIIQKFNAIKVNCGDAIVDLEVKSLDFSEWAPEGFGTGDCVIVADDVLEIIDFKYGKGVRVEAEGNTQMRLYALGALKRYGDLYDIKQVRMTIIQPRISAEPDTDEISKDDLIFWAENFVKPRAALAFAGEGEFNPDENTCKFCRAKEQCRARTEKNIKLFDDAPDLDLITVDEAGELLSKAADITNWLKDLESLIMRSLFEGAPVNGWKLVEGRSIRKFADTQKVAETLIAAGYDEATIYEQKLLNLTDMEKTFGKKAIGEILEDLIYKPKGKPTLAPEQDRRPEIIPEELILNAFDDTED